MDNSNVIPPANQEEHPPIPIPSFQSKNVLIIAGVFLLLTILLGSVYVIFTNQTKKVRTQTTQETSTKEPTVNLVTEYKNPLDKKNQYVNPFSEYKNPFDGLK